MSGFSSLQGKNVKSQAANEDMQKNRVNSKAAEGRGATILAIILTTIIATFELGRLPVRDQTPIWSSQSMLHAIVAYMPFYEPVHPLGRANACRQVSV
jgi:hypothetical protein